MIMDNLTEEQAKAELERIKEEEAMADPSIFNAENDPLKKAQEKAGDA